MKIKLGSGFMPAGAGIVSLLLATSTPVFAASYAVPPKDQCLIGQPEYVSAQSGDNVITVAKQYNVGFNAMKNANPQLDMARGFQPGTQLTIPTQHLLPDRPREGIIINLPEMRMYYFPKGTNQLFTYPIGIGKIGKTIPIKNTTITHKTKHPVWIPPQDIREFNLQQGIVLPRIMPPGPDNPLGPYAIYTGLPTYLIHSTIFPESVGTRASFGCIRMYESDIEEFFPSIKSGTPVAIINSPVKVGWQQDHLYLEAYESLEEHHEAYDNSLPGMVHTIYSLSQHQPTLIDWQLVSYINKARDGLPHNIGIKLQ